MHGELVVSHDPAGEFAERVVEAFLARPLASFTLALTGGDTARRCYERLAADGAAQIDWWGVDIHWTDEACDGQQANETLVRRSLLADVGAANACHPLVCTGEDGQAAATLAQQHLADLGHYDVVHGVLAPDGGVAGLRPHSPLLECGPDDLVGVASATSPGDTATNAVTLTSAGFARARLLLLCALGPSCADAFAAVVAGDPSVPATSLAGEHTVWIVDPAASQQR
jgi:6-phosphogluconolactonase